MLPPPGVENDIEWRRITVEIERYDGSVVTSGATLAYETVSEVARDSGGVAIEQLSIGDIGYRYRFTEAEVTVAVARGNVVVRVEAESRGNVSRRDAAATQLAKGILEQIEFV